MPSNLKKLIRARMDKTGESYQTAERQVRASAQLPDPSNPAPPEVRFEPTATESVLDLMSKRAEPSGAIAAASAVGDLGKVLGSTRGTQRMFDQTRTLQDALIPRGLRQMADLQRSLGRFSDPLRSMGRVHEQIARMADPFGITKLAGLGQIEALGRAHSAFAIGDSLRAMNGALTVHHDLLGTSNVFALARGLESALGSRAVRDCMVPFMKLDRSLAPILGDSSYRRWQRDFAKAVMPSLGVLDLDWQRPVAVLTPLAQTDLGASLSWISDENMKVAALLPAEEAPSTITIEVSVPCSFCGNEMISAGRGFTWKGNRKGILKNPVVPLCVECQRRSNDDPTYFSRAFAELDAPPLRIVANDGTSDGVPRGKLRLVRDERDDDDHE